MKLDLGTLNTTDIQSTSVKKKIQVRLSDNAQMMIFKSYTKNLYSNIIGSLVRELASNCFDAHIAAKTNDAFIIRLTYEINSYYLSFIDVGTGMSPETIADVYGVLFESTKRVDNRAHGAYGIGSKTPLAYGSRSFFLTTRFSGMEYKYNIYAGAEAPEIDVLSEEPTTLRNGTEVKVPIHETDLKRFVHEIINQLYYFENVIYEGFTENNFPEVTNNYKIYRSKTFVYRESTDDTKSSYSNTHLIHGQVAYPLDYDALGMEANKWKMPVAIIANIGDVGVTMNREALEYDKDTIAFIKKALNNFKAEIIKLYTDQCALVSSIQDLIAYRRRKYYLLLPDGHSMDVTDVVNDSVISINFKKFPYPALEAKLFDNNVLGALYSISCSGDRVTKHTNVSKEAIHGGYSDLLVADNVYHCEKRNLRTQRYLKTINQTRFFTITKDKFENDESKYNFILSHFGLKIPLTDEIREQLKGFCEEVYKYVEKNTRNYEKVKVPQNFVTTARSRGNKSINICDSGFRVVKINNSSIELSKLEKFNGTIYFGGSDENILLDMHRSIAKYVHGENSVATGFSLKNGTSQGTLAFLRAADGNLKYFLELPNALPVTMFPATLDHDQVAKVHASYSIAEIRQRYKYEIENVFKYKHFNLVDENLAKIHSEVLDAMNALPKNVLDLNAYDYKTVKAHYPTSIPFNFSGQKGLEQLLQISKKNKPYLEFIEIYDTFELKNKPKLAELLRKVLEL